MSKDEKQMQELADLGQQWDFLSSSLKPRDISPAETNKLQDEILNLIYSHAGRITLAHASGILAVIQHNLIKGDD